MILFKEWGGGYWDEGMERGVRKENGVAKNLSTEWVIRALMMMSKDF